MAVVAQRLRFVGEVIRIDAENNVIAVKGAVPGPKGGIVVITDSVKA